QLGVGRGHRLLARADATHEASRRRKSSRITLFFGVHHDADASIRTDAGRDFGAANSGGAEWLDRRPEAIARTLVGARERRAVVRRESELVQAILRRFPRLLRVDAGVLVLDGAGLRELLPVVGGDVEVFLQLHGRAVFRSGERVFALLQLRLEVGLLVRDRV